MNELYSTFWVHGDPTVLVSGFLILSNYSRWKWNKTEEPVSSINSYTLYTIQVEI